jgi:hypothetical protein
MIEDMVLEQLLDSFPIITGRTPTDEWHDHVEKVEGSPDHIIGRDGKAFGIELTEIRDADDAWGYVDEAYRLASKKSDSYTRRGIFRFPIALVMYSTTPPLFDIRKSLEGAISQADFETLGFSEVWAVDFSDAYYSSGHPLRRADMFCFKPVDWFGFHRIGDHDRKPYA